MRVAIAGAHGKIGRALTRLLAENGDTVIGLIRNPDHEGDVRADGGEPVVCDLEHAGEDAVTTAIRGADAAVFTAGAGPGSGAERKLTMDRDGAVKLLNASRAAGVRRFVIVSSIGAESPPPATEGDVFSVYLRAKADADAAVVQSDREWTILRPGRLTDEPPADTIRLDRDPYRGAVARADVAAVIASVLSEPRSVHATLYVNGGDTPIAAALDQALNDSA
jgi:nucleoside-diphosphate-sugar epimerase